MTWTTQLEPRLAGALHLPGSRAYEEACTLFNAAIERRPAAVAACDNAADVVIALRHARERGLPVAVRAGGHSAAGWSLCDDGLVLDVRGIAAVEVDPVARTATVGGGCLTGTLDRALQSHGLATTTGRVSTTGLAGFTLGGGSGWLERRFGFACDNLLAAELVTAGGERIHVSDEATPDLLWALRGAGANFGVVTSMTFRVHRLDPQVTGGLVLFDAGHGREFLRLAREVMDTAPEELTLGVIYLYGPDEDEVPDELRGRLCVGAILLHTGGEAQAERDLAPLRSFAAPSLDLVERQPYARFQCSIDDPPGYRNYMTAQQLPAMGDEAIDVIHAHAMRLPAGPGWTVIVPWGGAVRHPPVDTPLAHRDTAWVVHPGAFWIDPDDDEAAIAWGRGFTAALREFASGGVWLNWIGDEGEERVRAAFGDEAFARLQAVKARYDPDNVFRANHNIAPAGLRQPPP
ncbi:MAG TPA: FAD-binding oxidoreductase [Solirubrobacteraceae bacterium]|nr:FAD-binding oxidoreductase [Solirubrobacteraceae bacterium]